MTIGTRVTESEALAAAVGMAARNAAAGQLPFAALVVRDGVVIGAGVNTALADHDPSAHGEVTAIRDAARRLGSLDLGGATIYSSCEPCAICRLVAAASGAGPIVYAAAKETVPAWVDADPGTTAKLIDAVTAILPGVARPGHTDVDAAAPFGVAR